MNSGPVQHLTILGSTGSIGRNTLDVISRSQEKYSVYALSANENADILMQQCREFNPAFAVINDKTKVAGLQKRCTEENLQTEILEGPTGLSKIASDHQVDIVMAAIVGGAGLLPTLSAAKAGKKVLLANKESLVMAGNVFMQAVSEGNAKLLPIDSEHNAVFQCLPIDSTGEFDRSAKAGLKKIVLTASGGPFLHTPVDKLKTVTVEQACAHPNWKMGRKISIDSASMLNKALELIEASILFSLEPDDIDIVMHPQSIVHSMVYYNDGSVLAQLGNPDMRTPIAYGLAWPDRLESGVDYLDLPALGKLEFHNPDEEKFPCLRLGREAAERGGTAPLVLNAANEIAVDSFLQGNVSFTDIPVIIETVLNKVDIREVNTLDEILFEDAQVRKLSSVLINEFK